jgi:hypothetical protein
LDEYPALSGGKSQKYAIFKPNRIGKTRFRLLTAMPSPSPSLKKAGKRVCQPYYDPAIAETPELLWKNFNRPCGKLFALFLRQNLDLIRQQENYRMSDTVAGKLKKTALAPLTGSCENRNNG